MNVEINLGLYLVVSIDEGHLVTYPNVPVRMELSKRLLSNAFHFDGRPNKYARPM